MNSSFIEVLSSVLFFIAIIHTFTVHKFELIALRLKKKNYNALSRCCHYLSEIELVFLFWSLLLFAFLIILDGPSSTMNYVARLSFTEPIFIFVIMVIAANKTIIEFAEMLISYFSNFLHSISSISQKKSFYLGVLILGPLMGSLITEPAAMTVTSLLIFKDIFQDHVSEKFKYATLGLLFVNISIGGTLTHFAAPPVVMVASKWGWNTLFMFGHFGYKFILSSIISTCIAALIFKKDIESLTRIDKLKSKKSMNERWSLSVHLLFLVVIIFSSHQKLALISLFFIYVVTMKLLLKEKTALKLKNAFYVALFLSGLIFLGTFQSWWLSPLLLRLKDLYLFFGATALTSITDNAAITYLSSLVKLTDHAKIYLVAGSVAGGGLTIIANAPNAASFGILSEKFNNEGINPLKLLVGALAPTLIAIFCFLFLPNLIF